MNLHEIEELIKTVNRNAIKAMLRNAAILNDPKVSDQMKSQALENIKAINATNTKKKKKSVVAPPVEAATQLVQPAAVLPSTPQPAAAAAPKIEYPEGLHLSPLNAAGHNETAMRSIFESLPDHEKKHIADWHSNIKMNKSIESLYSLFSELKKHL